LLILIHGEETFLVKKKLQEFINYYKTQNPTGFDFFRFNAREVLFSTFLDAVAPTSLFSLGSGDNPPPRKKFVIVEEIGENKEFSQDIFDYIHTNPNHYIPRESPIILLLITCGTLQKNSPLRILCEEKGKVVLYHPLSTKERKGIFKKMWTEAGTPIDDEALHYFSYCVGGDLWRAAREVEKVTTYKKGSGDVIVRTEDLTRFIRPPGTPNAFALLDAFSQKEKTQTLFLWNAFIRQGSQPHILIASLLWQFKNLILVRSLIDERKRVSDIVRDLKLHPFVVRKTYNQAKSYSLAELEKFYDNLFWLDVNIKAGRQDPRIGFEKIVTNL